jgi:hypothetical protein
MCQKWEIRAGLPLGFAFGRISDGIDDSTKKAGVLNTGEHGKKKELLRLTAAIEFRHAAALDEQFDVFSGPTRHPGSLATVGHFDDADLFRIGDQFHIEQFPNGSLVDAEAVCDIDIGE